MTLDTGSPHAGRSLFAGQGFLQAGQMSFSLFGHCHRKDVIFPAMDLPRKDIFHH
jgi:hypothetical protein